MPPPSPSTPGRRIGRILLRIGLVLAVLLVVVVGVVLYLLAHLDSAPIKQRVVAAAHDAGIDLDYGTAGLSPFSGLQLHDVQIFSAPEDRAVAPTLVRIKEIRADWSLGALMGKKVGAFGIHGIELTVVQDENGVTSVDRFLMHKEQLSPPGPPPPPKPATPLSKLLESLLPPDVVSLDALVIDDISARLIMTKEGKPVEVVRAGTLGLTGRATAGKGKMDVLVDVGTEGKPLPIEVIRESVDAQGNPVAGSAKALTARPWIQFKGTEQELTLAFAVPLDRRELLPSLPQGNVATGLIRVRFQPAQSNTAVTVEKFDLIEGAATATAAVDLHDGPDGSAQPTVRNAKLHADLDLLVARLHDVVPAGISLKQGVLDADASEVSLAPAGTAGTFPGAPIVIASNGALNADLRMDSFDMVSEGSQTHVRKTRMKIHGQPGKIEVSGDIEKVALGDLAKPATAVDGITITSTVKPETDGRLSVTARVPIKQVAQRGASQVDVRNLALGVDGTLQSFSRFDGTITTSLDSAHYATRGQDAQLRSMKVALKLDNALYNALTPAASSAGVSLKADIADTTIRQGRRVIRTNGLALSLDTAVEKGDVKALTVQLPIDKLSVEGGPDDPHLNPSPLSLDVQVGELVLNRNDYQRSRAHITTDLTVGAWHMKADVDKQADSVAFDIDGSADRLGAIAGLARGSASLEDRQMLEQLGLTFQTKGTADHISRTKDLAVNHKTRIVLQRPSVHREELDFQAKQVDLKLNSQGTMQRHSFDLNVDLDAPRINKTGGDGHQTLALSGSFDMVRPHVDLHIAGEGVTGPDGKFDLAGGYDPATKVVDWSMDGKIGRLGLIGVVMPPKLAQKHRVDWQSLAFEAHGKGKHPTLVKEFHPGSPPSFVLAEEPLKMARGLVKLDMTASGVDYKGEDDTTLQMPSMVMHVNSNVLDGKAHADASIDIPTIHAKASGHTLDAEKLAPSFAMDTTGDFTEGDAKLSVVFTAASIQQDAEPGYPIGDMELKLKASLDTAGALRVERVQFDNKLGGTHLELHGGMDFQSLAADGTNADQVIARALATSSIPGRKNLLLDGRLTQKLDALRMDEKRFKGSGSVTVPFRLESGDIQYVHLTTAVRFAKVSVAVPGYSVTGLDGVVPMEQDVLVDWEKWTYKRLAGATAAAYRRVRFVDQLPFVSNGAVIAADQILADVSSDPLHPNILELKGLTANVRVDRNLIAIDQMEAAMSGGTLAGQLLIDDRGDDTELVFHGGVTGLQTSQDKARLDANAAVSLKPWKRLLEGRVEIVRLGTGHLNTMLDWYDPYGSSTKANRMRKVMAYGYPRQVRMRFEDGFAGIFVDLGGLGSAVRIDEITTQVGPMLERYLPARFRKKEEDL